MRYEPLIQCSGRGKIVTQNKDSNEVIITFTDEATAFHDVKRAVVPGKGAVINSISIKVFEILEDAGIKTHFIKKINNCEQLCHKVKSIPLNVVIRNVVSGSMAKRLGVMNGYEPKNTVYEIYYKNTDLGNPLINEDHAISLGVATTDELTKMKEIALKINDVLKPYFATLDLQLVDFKVEFGESMTGELLLADEISPDKSRLWDMTTGEHLDKDHFSRDLGDVKVAYEQILMRMIEKEGL